MIMRYKRAGKVRTGNIGRIRCKGCWCAWDNHEKPTPFNSSPEPVFQDTAGDHWRKPLRICSTNTFSEYSRRRAKIKALFRWTVPLMESHTGRRLSGTAANGGFNQYHHVVKITSARRWNDCGHHQSRPQAQGHQATHGFLRALKKIKRTGSFHRLPASRRNEIVRYLANLKTTASLQRIFSARIGFLAGVERFVGRQPIKHE